MCIKLNSSIVYIILICHMSCYNVIMYYVMLKNVLFVFINYRIALYEHV